MALEQAWGILKAAGREHTGSPSMPIAPTGGGSRPFQRTLRYHQPLTPTSIRGARLTEELEGQSTDYNQQSVPALPPDAAAGTTDDWGDKDYEQFFARQRSRRRNRPIGVKTRGWRNFPQHAPPSQV